MTEIDVGIPAAFKPLFNDKRYKVFYGGRSSGKSWNIARALLVRALQKPDQLILCAREVQKSVQESVHRLLSDQISLLGMSAAFDVQRSTIKCANGSQFIFEGLRHNVDNIKSYEGVDICWVEEAHAVSENSWGVLIPTIRKSGSQIWISFNPVLEEDATYQRFIINTPPDCDVVKINYLDNRHCTKEAFNEAEQCRITQPDAIYRNIWLGECKQAVDGAIFAAELERAKDERRITRVPIEPAVPVNTYWDLGRSDQTSIWFIQRVGMEWRVLDYYENNRQAFGHFLQVLDDKAYRYGTHFLPHDASHEHIAADASVERQMLNALRDNPLLGDDVQVVARIAKKHQAIDIARSIFGQCVFDGETTKDGLSCLRHYAYGIDADTGRVTKEPKHDIHSHGADAFMTFAQAHDIGSKPKVSLREFYA